MATSLQRIVAAALLCWHATLSVGGYGLHEVMGLCHPPAQHLSSLAAGAAQPEEATSREVATKQDIAVSCRSCCCRASWTKVAETRASDARSTDSTPLPAGESELVSAASGSVMVPCQLCQWLGQLSIPPLYVLPSDSVHQETAALLASRSIFIAPQPRCASPRGPPSLA